MGSSQLPFYLFFLFNFERWILFHNNMIKALRLLRMDEVKGNNIQNNYFELVKHVLKVVIEMKCFNYFLDYFLQKNSFYNTS